MAITPMQMIIDRLDLAVKEIASTGGGSGTGGATPFGGNGGSGIVIIRYLTN